MKAKIDKDGSLYLERAGKMKDQICPFGIASEPTRGAACGDWCPLFSNYMNEDNSVVVIYICHDKMFYINPDDFTDERQTKKGD